jgi:hypothetical protein
MPGVGRVRGGMDGGQLRGGAPRVVWQTLGADPRTVSAASAAQRLDQHARACHLVWNPLQGEIVQMTPILRAGRSLGWSGDLSQIADETTADETARVNTEGRICAQICVVAYARDPFTSWPMTGLPQILDWLDSWGIPRRWPAGAPLPFPHGLTARRDRRLWAQGGYFGASQVPGLTAAGPGAIDIERLTAGAGQPGRAAAQTAPVPVGSRPGEKRQPAAELGDLDEYFDHDEAGAAEALSRVG